MSDSGLRRYAPLAGIVFVALVVVAVIIGGSTPSNGDSVIKVAKFWRDNTSEQQWSSAIGAWATLFFVWFAASVRSVLRPVDERPARLSALSFAGAIIGAVGLLTALSIDFAIADAADDISPAGLQTLTALSNGFFFPIAVGFGLFYLATGLLAIRSRVFPVWLGWITVVIGIACITPAGFFALLVGAVWIVAMSVVLYLRESQTGPPAAAPASQPAAPTPGV